MSSEYLPNATPSPENAQLEQLRVDYDTWNSFNEGLITGRYVADNESLDRLKDLREDIAESALGTYIKAEDKLHTIRRIRDMVVHNPYTAGIQTRFNIEDPVQAAMLIPEYGKDELCPNLNESILSTLDCLEIAQHYTDAASEHAEGVLLSGSSAWGSFHATKGERIDRGESNDPSDIDLLIEISDLEAGWQTIQKYVDIGLVAPSELQRFALFSKMYLNNQVDIFSLRSHESGKEVSIHFVDSATLSAITNMDPAVGATAQDNQKTPVLRDYRPNMPSVCKSGKGYVLHDFMNKSHHKFVPETVTEFNQDMQSDVIAQSPLGIELNNNGQASYAIGVLPFFLAIHPVVIGERNNKMSEHIRTMQQNIGKKLGGHAPTSIIREERMTRYTRARVVDALTYTNDSE